MALTDAENTAISSLLTGGVEAPLEEQPGTEEKPVELAMFGQAGGKMGNFVQRMLFGDGLFKSRQVLDELKSCPPVRRLSSLYRRMLILHHRKRNFP